MSTSRHDRSHWKTSLAACALAALAACGGGGGSSGGDNGGGTGGGGSNTPVSLNGIVAGGPLAAAQLSVYAASGYVAGGSNTALASTTTGADGSYSVNLPAGTSGPLLLRATAGPATSTSDEVLGQVALDNGYALEAVVPASMLSGGGSRITVHVTPFTQAMASYVSRKFGRSDLDASITAARSAVMAKLTTGVDPLATSPVSDARMVTLLAAVSTIATTANGSAVSDPYKCASQATAAARLACTVKTVSGALQPLAATAAADSAVVVNYNPTSALQQAAERVDAPTVAAHSAISAADVSSQKTTLASAIKTTAASSADAAQGAASFFIRPRLVIKASQNGQLTILSGPDAGTYVGWSFLAQLCYGSSNDRCTSVGPEVSYTPEDARADPDLATNVQQKVSRVVSAVNQLMREALAANPSITNAELEAAVGRAITAGAAAETIEAGLAVLATELASLGGSGSVDATVAAVDSPEAIAAAQACAANSAYDNPDSTPYDPQLDSNCRLAQFDACLHRTAGVTAYDQEGRTACQVVNGLTSALTGNWSCRYCPYPY